MQIYFDRFESLEDVQEAFYISNSDLEGVEIIYAHYETPAYEGYAHVIFIKRGRIYEVNGSHCSCFGLEDQWHPEETVPLALLNRPNVSKEAKDNIKEYYKNLMIFF